MRRVSLLILAGAVACGDSSGPELVPASFQIVAGDNQVATVGRELPQLVEVRVLAQSAQPLPNYPVNWTALDGGSVFATIVYSGTDGIARQRWSLGPGAWPGGDPGNGRLRQRLVARLLDPETGAILVDDTVTAVARPDVAVGVTLHNNFSWLGDSVGVGVVYRDQFGNALAPCPGTGMWDNLTWWSADSSIAMPTGQLLWGGATTDGDRALYGYVRGLRLGSTSIGLTAGCVPTTTSFPFEVLVKP